MTEVPALDVCLPLLTMKSPNFNPLNNYQIGRKNLTRKNTRTRHFWKSKAWNT